MEEFRPQRQLKISIAIPTYNAGQKIDTCLASISSQQGIDKNALEVVMVDDRSTDDTWDRIQKSGHRSIQNKENLGLSGNWNRAVKEAEHSIVLLLHQDDELRQGALEAAFKGFQDPELALVAFSKVIRNDKEEIISPLANLGTYTGAEYKAHLTSFKNCPAPSLTFYRKDLLEGSTYYDPKYSFCPEMDLYIRLAQKNPDMKFIHDERALITRGSAETQFSRNYLHYGLSDKVALFNKYKIGLSKEMLEASKVGLARTMDAGIVRLIHEGRNDQVRALFKEPETRKWLLKNFMKLKVSIKVGLNQVLNK